jgi:hypothetical protein
VDFPGTGPRKTVIITSARFAEALTDEKVKRPGRALRIAV